MSTIQRPGAGKCAVRRNRESLPASLESSIMLQKKKKMFTNDRFIFEICLNHNIKIILTLKNDLPVLFHIRGFPLAWIVLYLTKNSEFSKWKAKRKRILLEILLTITCVLRTICPDCRIAKMPRYSLNAPVVRTFQKIFFTGGGTRFKTLFAVRC